MKLICECCEVKFEWVRHGPGSRPKRCAKHQGYFHGVGICKAEGCGTRFMKTGTTSTYCPAHKNYRDGHPPKGKQPRQLTGVCNNPLCKKEFTKRHPASKYCNDDCNPMFSSSAVRVAIYKARRLA